MSAVGQQGLLRHSGWIVLLGLFAYVAGAFSESHGFLKFVKKHPWEIWRLTLQHLQLVGISGFIAIGLGVPVGVLLTRGFMRRYKDWILTFLGIFQTVPSLAVIAISMAYLGIGKRTAIFGLIVYCITSIIRNTVAGIANLDPVVLDAGRGMGMTPSQLLFKVEMPNAMYIILTGIRTAMVINVGSAAMSFLVGGGGLGDLIFTGIALLDASYMFAGAVPTAALAVCINWLLERMEQWLISPGLVYEE
jgi:osmoprotectant transport system permease protein